MIPSSYQDDKDDEPNGPLMLSQDLLMAGPG